MTFQEQSRIIETKERLLMANESIPCFYSFHGLNYKNGYVTTCPTQTDQFYLIEGRENLPSNIFNSPGFRLHRKEMVAGQWSEGCHLCEENERCNLRSMRHDFTAGQCDPKQYTVFEGIPTDMYNYETGEMDFAGLRHVEIRFNNSCNMACLHCDQVYSSGWETKLKSYEPTELDHKHGLHQITGLRHTDRQGNKLPRIDLKMDEVEMIIRDLNENFPNIMKIDFSGGEVLKQKQFFLALDLLAEHPNAKNMEIFFYTNFNADFDPVSLSEKLSKFRNLSLNISVDAGRNMYSYFRDGSWDKLVENLNKFMSVHKKPSNIKTIITTSIYQVLGIVDVFQSLMTLDVDIIDWAPVQSPRQLNPALITLHHRDYIVAEFDKVKKLIYENRSRRNNEIKQGKKLRGFFYSGDKPSYDELSHSLDRSLKEMSQYVLSGVIQDEANWEAFLHYAGTVDGIFKKDFNQSAFKDFRLIKTPEGNQLQRLTNGPETQE